MHHVLSIGVGGFEERERPSEWLRGLRESASGYMDLLRESGDRVLAAYRIAVARCRTSARSTPVPTGREVHAALVELTTGARDEASLPSVRRVVAECEDAGLLVF
jgi:hypothetical protein